MLQNELIDEDLEHFEDMQEDEEYIPNPEQNEMVESAKRQSCTPHDPDSGALTHQDGYAPSDSEGNASEDADDLRVEGGQHDLRGSKPITNGSGLASEVASVKSTSPGGYNPRHREPLYWYSIAFYCLASDVLFGSAVF